MASNFLSGSEIEWYYTVWNTPADAKPGLITHWPPGFPFLLVGLEISWLDAHHEGLLLINALFLLITLFLTGYLVHNLSGSSLKAYWAILLVSASYVPVLHMRAWSEPGFIVFLMGGVTFVIRWMHTESRQDLLIAGGLLGIMLLFRYAGLGFGLPIWGIILIKIVLDDDQKMGEKVRDIFLFTTVLFLPIGLWLIRNFFVSGDIFGGGHQLKRENLLDNLYMIGHALYDHFGLGVAGLLLIFSSVTFPLFMKFYKLRIRPLLKNLRIVSLLKLFLQPVGVLFVVVLGYEVFVLAITMLGNAITDVRKLSPAYPLFVVACMTLPVVKMSKLSLMFAAIGLLLLLLFSLNTFAPLFIAVSLPIGIWGYRRFGLKRRHLLLYFAFTFYLSGQILTRVYQARYFLNAFEERGKSPVFQWARENALESIIYTDSFDILYAHLEHSQLMAIPRDVNDIDLFAERVVQNNGYVITYKWHSFGEFVTPEQFLESGQFMNLKDFGEWQVLIPTALTPETAPP